MPICTINILDEVNCKLTGLDPSTVRKCVSALKFMVPNARHLPQVKLGRWDGMVAFMTVGGNTQINMLDRVLPIISDAGYDVEINDARPEYDFGFTTIDENVISDKCWPADHATNPNEPIILRPHQVTIVNNFLDSPQGIQVVPTSGGKSIITATLSKLVEPIGRTILIVPNKQLVSQTEADYKSLGMDVGVYYGDRKEWNKTHTICTWQSLDRLYKSTKDGKTAPDMDVKAFIDGVAAIIVDEAHTADANALSALMNRVFNHIPIRWGLTGTMPKEEFKAISIVGSIGPVINTIKPADLQEAGVLSNCDINIIQIQDSSAFRDYRAEIDYLTTNKEHLEYISNFVSNLGDIGNTLVLVNNIATGKIMQKLIPGSVFVSGSMKVKDRSKEYKEVSLEDNKIIIATYGVASTGINIPRIFNLVIFEAGKSFVKAIQSIGRGLRKAHDKDYVDIYDICASTKYSKKHLSLRKSFYKEMGYPFQVIKTTIEN